MNATSWGVCRQAMAPLGFFIDKEKFWVLPVQVHVDTADAIVFVVSEYVPEHVVVELQWTATEVQPIRLY